MKVFTKQLKVIAYFLAILLLFQSCIAYKAGIISAEDAAQYDNRRIRIETRDGGVYKLKWIEENDGHVFSIKKTKRKYIDKNSIANIRKYDPTLTLISLDSNLNLQGNIEVVTKKGYQNYATYNFIKIQDDDRFIRGYMMTGKDTLTVIIPTEKIASIEVENRTGTIIGTTAIAIPALWLSTIIVLGIAYLFTPKGF